MKNVLIIAVVAMSVWSCSNDAKPIGDPEVKTTEAKTITEATKAKPAAAPTKTVDISEVPKEQRTQKIAEAIMKEAERRKEVIANGGSSDIIEAEALAKDASKRKAQEAQKAKAESTGNQAAPKTIGQMPATEKAKPTRKMPPNHALLTSILSKNVSPSGKVNYAKLLKNRAALDTYTNTLKNNPPHADWKAGEVEAYWVNVYNAFTLLKIINKFPINSITDLDGGKPWDKKWIEIGGKTYSLNQIENEILRPTFKDPEIHFMVNCAAKSCPPLATKAWTAGNLNSFGNSRAKSFINDKRYNEISASEVKLSKIFEWYGDDFGNLIAYLNKFSYVKINSDAKVSFKEYDWSLNN